MKKYIVSVASCLFALCMQSCFQDMDHPAFDYPESTGEVPTTPLKKKFIWRERCRQIL